ncbi:acyltransferase [Devosia sp. SD17-2]|uniref:acyltransferase family protein n=1 Tax=Devosia sp. SD17-2 TaxID=2976459 RepID=UPI0023D888DB|nr:acyltransferase [Devosia sp. SD17-2]WEJ32926.1 acyltransferase [Devosia sp. SD17-2]
MKSRNIAYIPELDHLRLLAALLVFAYHFFHFYRGEWRSYPDLPFLGLIVEGHTGVGLFFVLSGFIFMTIALANSEIDYRSFMRNRLLRIAPLFIVVFVVAISIGRDRFVATDLLYVFVTNLGGAPTSWHFATGPAWSISVEFTFYLVFPFLAAATLKRGPLYLVKWLALLLIIKLAAYHATDNSRHMLYSTLVGRFDQFLIGMLAAIAYARFQTTIQRWGRPLLLLAAVVVLIGVGIQARWLSFLAPEPKQPLWVIWGTIEAGFWAVLVVAYLGARVPWPDFLHRAFCRGGEWSFSFYMWHALVIFAVHQSLGSFGGTGALALGMNGVMVLGVTLVFAWLSYTLIEAPFLDMRSRYGRLTAKDEL